MRFEATDSESRGAAGLQVAEEVGAEGAPEWAFQAETLELPAEAVAKIQHCLAHPVEPGERLRAAARRFGG